MAPSFAKATDGKPSKILDGKQLRRALAGSSIYLVVLQGLFVFKKGGKDERNGGDKYQLFG